MRAFLEDSSVDSLTEQLGFERLSLRTGNLRVSRREPRSAHRAHERLTIIRTLRLAGSVGYGEGRCKSLSGRTIPQNP
jgi:hypothetical protein